MKENDILKNFRKINKVLSDSREGVFSFSELCEIMSETVNSNIYLFTKKGKILNMVVIDADISSEEDVRHGWSRLSKEQNARLMQVNKSLININRFEAGEIFGQEYSMEDKFHAIIPAVSNQQRVGSLLVASSEKLDDISIALCEYATAIMAAEIGMGYMHDTEMAEKAYNEAVNALDKLTEPEIEVLKKFFTKSNISNGLVLTGKTAKELKIPMSVIANVLRKLESSKIIGSMSLGFKGTKISILNKYLMKAINEME